MVALCSLMVVVGRNPVASIVFLIFSLVGVAGIFALLGADFLAAVQVIVYAGAIMVLFLFVVMMLRLEREKREAMRLTLPDRVALGLTVAGFGFVAWKIVAGAKAGFETAAPAAATEVAGNTQLVGMKLFTTYLWPFELASVLILLALVAAVMIARGDGKPATRPVEVDDGSR
jgi:NADH-quinone oxidoreductase subunit J